MFDVVQIGNIINLWILHPWKILLELDASFDAETHKHETTNSDGDPDNTERVDEPVFRIWKRAKKNNSTLVKTGPNNSKSTFELDMFKNKIQFTK